MAVHSLTFQVVPLVLKQYELSQSGPVDRVEALGNAGGFSGAKFWRVTSGGEQFCLRLWPESGHVPDLRWVHEVLERSSQVGVPVAVPIANRAGQTWVQWKGRYFELAPWMPGAADFNTSANPDRLRSLMRAVASFHHTFHGSLRLAASPAIANRCEQLRRAPGIVSELTRSRGVDGLGGLRAPTPAIEDYARRMLPVLNGKLFGLVDLLTKLVSIELQLGPVIRDLHHDHVLFTGNQVTGIVDFGSMAVDTRCLDLARLVGSLEMQRVVPWELALGMYSQHVLELGGSELSRVEIELIGLLNRCNQVLGSLNWLDWILLQNRRFDDWAAVEKRLQYFAKTWEV